MNYALVYGGIGLAAILFVENAVSGGAGTALIFLSYGSPGLLVLVSLLIGMMIGFGIKSFMTDDDNHEDYDF